MNARIVLEGRLEHIERALLAWESAAKSLESAGWATGALFALVESLGPELDEAVLLVRRNVTRAPELGQLLTRLDKAKSKVRERVRVRLDLLGIRMPNATAEQVVSELKSEMEIVFEGHLGWPSTLSRTITFLCGTCAAALALRLSPFAAVPVLFGLLMFALRRAASTPVLLTRRALVFGHRSMRLENIVFVTARTALFPNRNAKQCELEIVFNNQPVWRGSSAGTPGALIDGLRSVGVRCEVESAGFVFFW